MPLTYTTLGTLVNNTGFLARVEIAIIKYATYLRNINQTGALGNWASAVINDANTRSFWVQRLKWYVLLNVSINWATADLDDADSDTAISSQVETQVQNLVS